MGQADGDEGGMPGCVVLVYADGMDAHGRSGDRFDEVDGYRGIAAIMVAVFHVHFQQRADFGLYASGGTLAGLTLGNFDVGVAWFFVLSGFLIFLPFARAYIAQTPVPALRSFFVRRAARIIPAYYCALILTWVFTLPASSVRWADLLAHLSFTHVFSEAYLFSMIRPGWSVAVEMIFYLAIGATAPVLHRLCGAIASPRRRAATLIGACLVLALASVAYKFWIWDSADLSRGVATLYFGPLARVDSFACGMALAVIVAASPRPLPLPPRGALQLRVAAMALMSVAFLGRFLSPVIYLYFHTMCGLAFALLLASTVSGSAHTRRARGLAHPVPRFLGTISYGIYLWHGPLLDNLLPRGLLLHAAPDALWANIALLLGLTLLFATASYYVIERPALRWVQRRLALSHTPGPARDLAAGGQIADLERALG